jgi:hypothetical protein
MESIIPSKKTVKSLTVGGLLLSICGYLIELRETISKIETKVEYIERRFVLIDQEETFKKIIYSSKNKE